MAAKKRTKDHHLPKRVYFNHGRYFYVDNKNKWINLGKTLPEAMNEWTKLIQPDDKMHVMSQLFDRYMIEIAPKKAKASYRSNLQEIKVLRVAFGDLPPESIDPVMIYRFMDKRGKLAPVSANREKALLSHVFTHAIRWGVVRENPCRDVQNISVERRDRYITDEEFAAVKNIASPLIQNIMDFAYITGLRQLDILNLKLDNLTESGIQVLVHKTKTKLLICWTEKLKAVTQRAIEAANAKNTVYLFSTNQGKPFTSSGFQSNWQKLLVNAINSKVISERFTFHDIRRKTATDLELKKGREMARRLLGHADQQMTANYISGTQQVWPLE